MEIRILGILLLLTATISGSSAASTFNQRYGGGGARIKRPFAPSLEGSNGYSYVQPPTSLPYVQQGAGYNNPANAYSAPAPSYMPLPSMAYSGRPYGLPEEKSRYLHSGYTLKLPDVDPPPPPIKSSYVSKPYSDYVVRFNSGSNYPSQVTVINRPSSITPPRPPSSPPFIAPGVVDSFYLTDDGPPPPALPPQPEDAVNFHPQLTSVYVISATDKKEGAKEAYIGLHKDPAFGTSADPGVIRPLTPNVVYSPNQNPPGGEQGDEFKPMYIFGPVFYPKSDAEGVSVKDNVESGSSASAVLKSPANDVVNSSATTTTTTPAPSSSESSIGEESKDAGSDATATSDESSSSGTGGGRGLIGVIKGLLGVNEEALDDLDDTNSRADSDKSVGVDEEEAENDNSTSKTDVKDVEPEIQDDNVEKPKVERVKNAQSSTTIRKSSVKKNRNRQPSSSGSDRRPAVKTSTVSTVVPAEDKKQTGINEESAIVPSVRGPQQHLETVESEHEHAVQQPQPPVGTSSNEDDPDPIVGPLQIGFIGAPPLNTEQQFGPPMQPYFYPAGIPLYNRPPLNPFSPTGTGFSHDQMGFEADHTQQQQQQQPQQEQPQQQRFTPEMIQHEQEKVQQNFEQQRNQINVQQPSEENFEKKQQPEVEESEVQSQPSNSPVSGDKVETPAHAEQGITIENKRTSTVESVDHTDRYDDLTTITDSDSSKSNEQLPPQQQDTSTAYADLKSDYVGNYYRDVSPASQTSSQLHVEQQDLDNKQINEEETGQDMSGNDVTSPSTPLVQSTFDSVPPSSRRPFPSFHHQRYQGHFRPKNRNYVAPTTYRPSYPRTSPTASTEHSGGNEAITHNDDDNSLDDQKDSSATLYNSIHYDPTVDEVTFPSSAVTPVIHVEPYNDRQLDTANSETVSQIQAAPYGSRIRSNGDTNKK